MVSVNYITDFVLFIHFINWLVSTGIFPGFFSKVAFKPFFFFFWVGIKTFPSLFLKVINK